MLNVNKTSHSSAVQRGAIFLDTVSTSKSIILFTWDMRQKRSYRNYRHSAYCVKTYFHKFLKVSLYYEG
jgi:hypothetical protein